MRDLAAAEAIFLSHASGGIFTSAEDMVQRFSLLHRREMTLLSEISALRGIVPPPSERLMLSRFMANCFAPDQPRSHAFSGRRRTICPRSVLVSGWADKSFSKAEIPCCSQSAYTLKPMRNSSFQAALTIAAAAANWMRISEPWSIPTKIVHLREMVVRRVPGLTSPLAYFPGRHLEQRSPRSQHSATLCRKPFG